MEMEIPKDIKEMADTGENKVKTVPAQQVAYTVHKGPYDQIGEVMQKLSMWVFQQGYEIVGPPQEVYHTRPDLLPPEEWITEVRWPIKKK